MNSPRVDARMVRAFLASVATAVVVYLVVIRGTLPLVTRRLTSEQVDWLRRGFNDHPWMALSSVTIVALLLALPALAAFRIVYGSWGRHT